MSQFQMILRPSALRRVGGPALLLAWWFASTACSNPSPNTVSVNGNAVAAAQSASPSPLPSASTSVAATPTAGGTPSAGPSYGNSLFPFIDGAVWTYDVSVNDSKAGTCVVTCSMTETTPVPKADFKVDTTVEPPGGTPTETITHELYKVFPDQLLTQDNAGDILTELKFPITLGENWTVSTLEGNESIKVVDQEPIVTGYKEFQNVWRVASSAPDGTSAISWYADGVGRIRTDAIDLQGNTFTLLLRSFQP